jgi:hypothetical protein
MSGFVETTNDQTTPLSRFLQHVKHVLVGMIVLLLVVYVGDYVVVRVRIAKRLDPYGIVQVRRSYVVTMKNGKPEYFFESPADQTCVNSLFPHFGYPACWHLRRETIQQVKM